MKSGLLSIWIIDAVLSPISFPPFSAHSSCGGHPAMPAPVDGLIAQRSVQVGQHVAPGTPLMTIVPLGQLWVEANFKEGQLRHMKPGQNATLTADLYGDRKSTRLNSSH